MIKTFNHSVLQSKEEKRQNRTKVALSVLLLFVVGSLLNIPFSREVRRLTLPPGETDKLLDASVWNHVLTNGLSSLLLGSILIFVGLWVSERANLGAPVLARMFSSKPLKGFLSFQSFLAAIGLSIFVAVVLLGLFEIQKAFYPVDTIVQRPEKFYYFFVSFSAGITEEIMFRLCLMTLIIALIQYAKKSENPSDATVWTGNLIAAIFFGLMHLPLSSNFVELAPFTIGVNIVGNLITGSTFGWIYWKKGLLTAITAHVAFDLVFHVVGSPYN